MLLVDVDRFKMTIASGPAILQATWIFRFAICIACVEDGRIPCSPPFFSFLYLPPSKEMEDRDNSKDDEKDDSDADDC